MYFNNVAYKNTHDAVMGDDIRSIQKTARRDFLVTTLKCVGVVAAAPLLDSCTKAAKGNLVALDYASMKEIRVLVKSNTLIESTLKGLLGVYDPRLPLVELERRINLVFEKVSLPEYWRRGPGFQVNKAWLVHVAHALWVENNHVVPWSLRDYTPNQIQFIVPCRLLRDMPPAPSEMPLRYRDPNSATTSKIPTLIELESYKLFPLALSLSKNRLMETLFSLVDWETKNVFHTYVAPDRPGEAWTADIIYKDYPAWDWSVPLNALVAQRAVGCGLASSLAVALARSINIPAEVVLIDEHRAAWFPSANRLVHGDNIAMTCAPPPDELVMTPDKIRSLESVSKTGRGYHYSPQPNALKGRHANTLYVFGNYPSSQVYRSDNELHPDYSALLSRLKEFNPRFEPHATNPDLVVLRCDPLQIKSLEKLRGSK